MTTPLPRYSIEGEGVLDEETEMLERLKHDWWYPIKRDWKWWLLVLAIFALQAWNGGGSDDGMFFL